MTATVIATTPVLVTAVVMLSPPVIMIGEGRFHIHTADHTYEPE